MSKTADVTVETGPEPRAVAERAWTLLEDVELRGQWFLDEEHGGLLECRRVARGTVLFRARTGREVVIPRRLAEESLRLVRGPEDPRPPTRDQLPSRVC
jgi:hypothetical protein